MTWSSALVNYIQFLSHLFAKHDPKIPVTAGTPFKFVCGAPQSCYCPRDYPPGYFEEEEDSSEGEDSEGGGTSDGEVDGLASSTRRLDSDSFPPKRVANKKSGSVNANGDVILTVDAVARVGIDDLTSELLPESRLISNGSGERSGSDAAFNEYDGAEAGAGAGAGANAQRSSSGDSAGSRNGIGNPRVVVTGDAGDAGDAGHKSPERTPGEKASRLRRLKSHGSAEKSPRKRGHKRTQSEDSALANFKHGPPKEYKSYSQNVVRRGKSTDERLDQLKQSSPAKPRPKGKKALGHRRSRSGGHELDIDIPLKAKSANRGHKRSKSDSSKAEIGHSALSGHHHPPQRWHTTDGLTVSPVRSVSKYYCNSGDIKPPSLDLFSVVPTAVLFGEAISPSAVTSPSPVAEESRSHANSDDESREVDGENIFKNKTPAVRKDSTLSTASASSIAQPFETTGALKRSDSYTEAQQDRAEMIPRHVSIEAHEHKELPFKELPLTRNALKSKALDALLQDTEFQLNERGDSLRLISTRRANPAFQADLAPTTTTTAEVPGVAAAENKAAGKDEASPSQIATSV